MIRHLKDLPTRKVSLTGKFMAVYPDGRPVLYDLDGAVLLPVFSTPEKLHASMTLAVPDAPIRIQVIQDHAAFLSSLEGRVRLMYDPWITDEGNTRYLELTAAHLAN